MDQYERGYDAGFAAGIRFQQRQSGPEHASWSSEIKLSQPKKKKLSAWQLFVKANASKPRFKYKSGAKKGRINLKALGVAYRKTPAGKKSSRR